MKIVKIDQGSDEWLEYRKGKISGTILGDVYSKRGGRKIGFYSIIAERLGLDPDGELPMDRGLRLECDAIGEFEKRTGIKTEQAGVCVSDFNDNIINSPDRLIKEGNKYTGAVEAKCLSSARHLQVVIENKIPAEFEAQLIQYFIVNKDLQTLYFVFFDPRIPSVPYHCIETHRADVEEKIKLFTEYQLETLKEIDEIIERLAF